jgi:PAS domain S-box-containing protein
MSEPAENGAGFPARHAGVLPRPAAVAAPASPQQQVVLSALGDLEIAHEELRVAEEELDEQRRLLQDVVEQYESGARWREHLFALLPVGVLVTDDVGTVLETNGAAAAMLGVRPAVLIRKPLPVYVDPGERRQVRDVLARLAHGEPELRSTVRLRARTGDVRAVQLVALRDPAARPPAIRWLLMPRETVSAGPLPTSDDDLRAATAVAELCMLPTDSADQQRLLGDMTLVLRSAVRSATTVSVTIGDPTAPDRLASDSIEAQQVDGLQLQLGEGPCVEAYRSGGAVVVADLTADDRWPKLATAARSQPLRSVLALPIRLDDERAGVVNIYAHEPEVFAERSVRVGEIITSALAAVLRGVHERTALRALVHHLERALNSRAVIEQAKGIVIAHHGGTPDEAFARLVTFSSKHNVKLRDLATLIVEGGGTGDLADL